MTVAGCAPGVVADASLALSVVGTCDGNVAVTLAELESGVVCSPERAVIPGARLAVALEFAWCVVERKGGRRATAALSTISTL